MLPLDSVVLFLLSLILYMSVCVHPSISKDANNIKQTAIFTKSPALSSVYGIYKETFENVKKEKIFK